MSDKYTVPKRVKEILEREEADQIKVLKSKLVKYEKSLSEAQKEISELQEKIKALSKEKKGIVFAGSPRTLYEAEKILPLLEKLYGKANIKIFLLDLPLEQSIWRNSHRRICELMRHPILYNKETLKLTHCPLDGSKLIKRALDKPEVIKKRY